MQTLIIILRESAELVKGKWRFYEIEEKFRQTEKISLNWELPTIISVKHANERVEKCALGRCRELGALKITKDKSNNPREKLNLLIFVKSKMKATHCSRCLMTFEIIICLSFVNKQKLVCQFLPRRHFLVILNIFSFVYTAVCCGVPVRAHWMRALKRFRDNARLLGHTRTMLTPIDLLKRWTRWESKSNAHLKLTK